MKKAKDPRHEARKIALQALFEWSFNSLEVEEILKRNLDTYDEVKPDVTLATFLVKGVTDNLDSLDEIIKKSAPEWPIHQIAKIDLEILRLAIFELYIARNVPPKVSIDEAVELAKEFGGENSSKFVNGVLGTVVKELMPEIIEKGREGKKQKMSVFEDVRQLISEQFGAEQSTIEKSSHLQDDLNADPLSVADLVISLEDKFKIKIPQEEMVKFNTVSDIVDFIEDQIGES